MLICTAHNVSAIPIIIYYTFKAIRQTRDYSPLEASLGFAIPYCFALR